MLYIEGNNHLRKYCLMTISDIKEMKEKGEVFPGTYDHIFKSVI